MCVPGVALVVLGVAATALIVVRLPKLAAIPAVAGLMFLAVAGLYLAWRWIQTGVFFPSNRYGSTQYGGGDVSSADAPSEFLTSGLAIAFLCAGVLLIPRTLPRARGLFGWAYDPDLLKRVQRLAERRT